MKPTTLHTIVIIALVALLAAPAIATHPAKTPGETRITDGGMSGEQFNVTTLEATEWIYADKAAVVNETLATSALYTSKHAQVNETLTANAAYIPKHIEVNETLATRSAYVAKHAQVNETLIASAAYVPKHLQVNETVTASSLFVGNNARVNGTFGVGVAPAANQGARIGNTISPGPGQVIGTLMSQTLTAGGDDADIFAFQLAPTIATGTRTGLEFWGVIIDGSDFVATGTGTITNAYSLQVRAPAIATNNWAIYVPTGKTRLDTLEVGGSYIDMSDSGAVGTCTSAERGQLKNVQGAGGVADTLQMCMKSAADTYSWKTIVTG